MTRMFQPETQSSMDNNGNLVYFPVVDGFSQRWMGEMSFDTVEAALWDATKMAVVLENACEKRLKLKGFMLSDEV